ncbi:GacS/BarA family sensor protein [Candidatus Rickettsiella viridis]|uniref:GacS/BarA family sensor protein n=1 Tax=Candidatus Rickettsiella viridis TaxID=676208 RepID=A0A2Z5UT49_9COXI|nr:response regulator [Candidatus Rickettsiella viridis]BBB14614.1 GacS/BarA family sensor protein [Candidatus Rickettsiella viridis]
MENKKIFLLVEDDPIIQRVHRAFLEKMGFQVELAATGAQALEMFKSRAYHLIILDGGLPDMQGVEVGRKIRSLERENKTTRKPILLLSAYTSELLKRWCKEAEIDSFLIKPVDYKDLLFTLENYFSKGIFSDRAA